MLNIFPDLLTYSLFAPFIIRIILGITTIYLGAEIAGRRRAEIGVHIEELGIRGGHVLAPFFALIHFVGGGLVLLGLWTQIGAIFLIATSLLSIVIQKYDPIVFGKPKIVYVLLMAMAVSLLFSGAGFIAFDLPL